MPPKSSNKKSNTVSWYNCEKCDAHITYKDRETHETVCPIGENATETADGLPLEYVRKGNLYTASVERRSFDVPELTDVSAKYVNNFVFISEGAMRLAGLRIGQQVVIRAVNKDATTDAPQLIRTVWPIPERFLTTIFASERDFKTYWPPLKGKMLKVERLPVDFPTPAKMVYLQLQNDDQSEVNLSEDQLKDAERVLKHELKDLTFAKGSAIHMEFFNISLSFRVMNSIFVFEEESSLEQDFGSLNISNSNTNAFFQITAVTQIVIERPEAKESEERTSEELTCTKNDIGGLDEQLLMVEEYIDNALNFRSVPKGSKISRSLLLYGPAGCGKTLICNAMCQRVQERSTSKLKTHCIKINTGDVFSRYLGETEKNLNVHFDKAYANYPMPTLIVIEDVQNLCPKSETNDLTKRISVAFSNTLDTLNNKLEATRTFVLATTSNIEALNPSIRRCGRLDREVEIGVPSPEARCEILHCLLRKVDHNLTTEHLKEVAQVTHGFVGADLAHLVSNALLRYIKAGNSRLSAEDLNASLTTVKPSAMREVLIENPNVHWSDIGGQAELKLKLRQAIEWPLLYADKFKQLGINPPRGILMFGPPGCSKTMIAKALATESKLNFLSIKGPELFSMWVGESERAVREVFRKARQVAPAIVFFDEIDAIGGERTESGSGSGTSVQERVLTQLLTEMDGVEALENVTIVAATNRPDMIDRALLRPGRFDRIIYVGLPDANVRHEIFLIKFRSMPVASDMDVDELVQRTEGYSGAEIQAVCQEAALSALQETFEAKFVMRKHFEYALEVVQPRTSPELLRLYVEYMRNA